MPHSTREEGNCNLVLINWHLVTANKALIEAGLKKMLIESYPSEKKDIEKAV